MILLSGIGKKVVYGGKFVVYMTVQAMELMSVHRLDSVNYLWRIKCLTISVSTFRAIEKAISTGWNLMTRCVVKFGCRTGAFD